MSPPQTRRSVLQIGALATAIVTGGCLFGAAHRGKPDQGNIMVIGGQQEWMDGQTLRIVARADGTTALDRSYQLPVDALDLTIEPGTYEMTVYIDGNVAGTYEWDVTKCASDFYIDFGNDRSDGVHLDTSDC